MKLIGNNKKHEQERCFDIQTRNLYIILIFQAKRNCPERYIMLAVLPTISGFVFFIYYDVSLFIEEEKNIFCSPKDSLMGTEVSKSFNNLVIIYIYYLLMSYNYEEGTQILPNILK